MGQRGSERQVNSEASENRKKYRAFNESEWETESAVCPGNDGLSSQLDGITFSDWSKESIKAAGNAIVPQVAHQIFKAIELDQ